MTSSRRGRRAFTLIEVMAALMLLAISMTVLLEMRNNAIAGAAEARDLALASRLGVGLLHRIRAGRVPDLFDGYQGDFADQDQPGFHYVIGIGDGSVYSGGNATDPTEQVWRDQAEKNYEESQDSERKPELTRVFVTVSWQGRAPEEQKYTLETLIPTWAVDQDFELYQQLWGTNLPAEVR